MTSAYDVELNLFIRRSPDSVKKWWTEFPDDYVATDAREQPQRIVTKKHSANGRELLCFWRSPDGSERQTQETMYLVDDNSWAFDVLHPAGFKIRDEFHTTPVEGGTRLEIRSKLIPTKQGAEAAIPAQKERMVQAWKNVVPVCERDAP